MNGRFVKSQLLSAALEEAYRNRLLKGKFPGCVLHIELPRDRVDVNVHPAKTVVKFVSDKTVFDAVYYTILDTLTAGERAAQKPKQEGFYQNLTVRQFKDKTAPQAEPAPRARSARLPPARWEIPTKSSSCATWPWFAPNRSR